LCALSQETGLTRSKADQLVELFFGQMANAPAKGDRVEIRGLCGFFFRKGV
jgi:integration host factor subunit beta